MASRYVSIAFMLLPYMLSVPGFLRHYTIGLKWYFLMIRFFIIVGLLSLFLTGCGSESAPEAEAVNDKSISVGGGVVHLPEQFSINSIPPHKLKAVLTIGDDSYPMSLSEDNLTVSTTISELERQVHLFTVSFYYTEVGEEDLLLATASRNINLSVNDENVSFDSGEYEYEDKDGDGDTNLVEISNGTDPNYDERRLTTIELNYTESLFVSDSKLAEENVSVQMMINEQLYVISKNEAGNFSLIIEDFDLGNGSALLRWIYLSGDEARILASVTKQVMRIDQIVSLQVDDNDFVYVDADGDQISDLVELSTGTDPDVDERITDIQISFNEALFLGDFISLEQLQLVLLINKVEYEAQRNAETEKWELNIGNYDAGDLSLAMNWYHLNDEIGAIWLASVEKLNVLDGFNIEVTVDDEEFVYINSDNDLRSNLEEIQAGTNPLPDVWLGDALLTFQEVELSLSVEGEGVDESFVYKWEIVGHPEIIFINGDRASSSFMVPAGRQKLTAQLTIELPDGHAVISVIDVQVLTGSLNDPSINPELYSLIREVYPPSDGDIYTAEEFDSCRELYLSKDVWISQTLTTVEGLGDFLNLESILLGGHEIVDISDLAGLTQLWRLYLLGNQIESVEALENITDLTILLLQDNKLKDLVGLEEMVLMEILYLTGQVPDFQPENYRFDLGPLAGMINLKFLDLDSNKAEDLSPLRAMMKLEELKLHSNNVVNPSSLSGLESLVDLDLSNNEIVDFTFTEFPSLETLDLSENNITNIAGVGGLQAVRSFNISFNEISDMSPISAFSTSLESLNMTRTLVSDLTFLGSGFLGLKDLYIRSVNKSKPFDFLEPLNGLNTLETLELSEVWDIDLSAIDSLTGLRSLKLTSASAKDGEGIGINLSGLSNLTELALQDVETNAVTGIPQLSALEWLKIVGNGSIDQVFNVADIEGLSEINYLRLENQNIDSLDFISGLSKLDTLLLANNNLGDDENLVSTLTQLTQTQIDTNGDASLKSVNLYNQTPLIACNKIITLESVGIEVLRDACDGN